MRGVYLEASFVLHNLKIMSFPVPQHVHLCRWVASWNNTGQCHGVSNYYLGRFRAGRFTCVEICEHVWVKTKQCKVTKYQEKTSN